MSSSNTSTFHSDAAASHLFQQMVASWSTAVALVEINNGYRIRYVNPAFENLTGQPAAESAEKSIHVLLGIPEEWLPLCFSEEGVAPAARTANILIKRRDGTRVPVNAEALPLTSENAGTLACAVVLNDATRRMELESALERSEARHRQLAENTRDLVSKRKETEATLTAMHGLLSAVYEAVPVGLCLLDSRGYVQLCNQAFSDLFGMERAELAGRPISGTLSSAEIALATGRPGTLHTFEAWKRDGGPFPAELSVTQIKLPEGTWRLLTLSDLTERRRMEARLREARQLESLGTLAAGIAHDFNNMLTIILGYAGLLTEQAGDPVALDRAASAIIDASRRGADVVRQLQLFANQHEVELMPTDLQSLIDETIQRTSSDWPANVQVSSTYGAKSTVISLDPTQVSLGLRHLLQNACDALPQGGMVKVSTRESHMPAAHGGESLPAVLITIEDSGHGMDDSTRARIFDPFFAKDKGPAVRGLGLAVVYGIMRAHRGQIEVDSAPGQGTRVHLWFPRDSAGSTSGGSDDLTRSGAGSARLPPQCVLVVEDETDIGLLWENVFESEGIAMRWARDGEEALRLFAAHRDEIGLLFTDIGLPGIDGWEVAQRIRAEVPSMPLLLVSGAFKPGDRSESELGPPAVCLPKPFPPSEVLAHVRRFLNLSA